MEVFLNADRSFKIACDNLLSNNGSTDIRKNLIIESSYNTIDFSGISIIFDGHVDFSKGSYRSISISNVSEITTTFLTINSITLPENVKISYNSVNDGYIRNTSIGYNPIDRTIGRSDAYFTYINVSGDDSTFNNSLYVNKNLLVHKIVNISNSLLINGMNFSSIETSFNSIRNAIARSFYSDRILTRDATTTNVSISNNLYVLKTAYFNDISINGQLLINVLKVPGLFTIDPSGYGNASGTLIINGDLMVNGTQTSIASSNIDISDLAITLASKLSNIQALSNSNAGLDISNIASLKYNGTTWNFSGGLLHIDNKQVLLNNDLSLAKRNFDLSLISIITDFSSSFFRLKRNIDNSYNTTYTQSQIDSSFILRSAFDGSYSFLKNTYLDNSYISKSTFDSSLGAIRTLMDTSYVSSNLYQSYQNITYQNTYERQGQIITNLSGGTDDRWGLCVAINEEGNIFAGTSSQFLRIYKYNDISWIKISPDIYGASAVSLNSDGTIVAIGDRSLNAFAGQVSVYRYVIDNSWVKINQSMTFTTVRFADDAISLNSSGTILAIGSPFDNATGSYSGRTSVYKYITDGSWVPLGIAISGETEYSYAGYSVSLNSSGYILAIGASYNNNAGGTYSGQVRVYRYTNDTSWVLISQDIDGTSSYDQVGFSVSLNGDGTLVACGAMADPRTGYVKVYKYISDGSWIPQGQTLYGEATNDQFGFTVSLNKQGNILGIGGPYNDGSANNAGHVRMYKYNDVSWIQIATDIDGDTANDQFGTSIALNGLGNRFVVGAPNSYSGRGYVKVYNYQSSIVNTTSITIPNEFNSSYNSFTEKLDISYLLNSVFEASHNSLKQKFDISFASINIADLEVSSIIIETINTKHNTQKFNNNLWNIIGQDISSIPNNKVNKNKNIAISNDGKVVAYSLNDNLSIQQVEQSVSTWNGSTTQACEWSSICWSPQRERFVAVANDGYIMTSSNGINWTNVPIFNSFNYVDSTTTVTNLLAAVAVSSYVGFAITSELAQNELIAAIGHAQSGTAGNIYVQDVSGATLSRNLITLTGAGQSGSQRLGLNISITNDAQFIAASTNSNGKLHLWKKNTGSTLGYTYLNSFTMTDQTGATNIKVKLTTNSILDVPYEMLLAVGIREGATGNIGRVRVYSINKTTGAFTLVDQFAGAIADNGFGANIGISPNGVTLVIQAASYTTPTAFCNIYTYNYTTSQYTLTQTINGQVATTGASPPNPRWDDFPGSKIVFNSSSSNTMALASFVASFGVGTQVGYVDIYNKVSNTWVLYQRIDGTRNAQYFGWSIGFDANGSTLIIGGSGTPNMTVYRKFIDSSYVSVAVYTATPSNIPQASSALLSADGTRYIISSGESTTFNGRFFCGNVITRGVSLKSICWSQELGLFVATATSGTKRVMTSPDGLIWSGRIAAEANPWLSVCWSPELRLFAAVASSGTNRVMISSNGTDWTPITVTDTNGCTSVCWSSELRIFVAVSSNNGRYRVMTSNDGTSWTGRTAAEDNSWNSVCWSPDLALFVALSGNSGTYRVMTSNDGISWTGISVAEDNSWNSVCWSPQLKLFAAVASNVTNLMTSPNGITWTARPAAQANLWRGVCWSPELGMFAAVSENGTNRVMTSSLPTTTRAGRVYVYELSYNNWNSLGTNAIVGLSGDELGYSLALSSNGRIVAASSLYKDDSAGQVRLFELSNNTNSWIQKGSNINGPRPGSESGYSISLAGNGNRIAIGAWKDNSNGTNAGAVRVYDFSASINDWRQQGQTIAGISGSFEGYVTALSLDGQTLASGSILTTISGTNVFISGLVKTFTISGTRWTSKGIINGPDISNSYFGRAIKLSGNGSAIVIGSPGSITNMGQAYVYGYTETGTTWTQLGQSIQGISGGDEFGSSVSMSNDGTLISVGSNNNNYNRGHVRVFSYANNYWYQLSNSIDGKITNSNAGIHALSGDGTTLIQNNNTYNTVYGINKPLAFVPSITTINTTISGDLAVTGKAYLKSFRISNRHNFDVSINGYSSHYLATSDISASIVDYYSNVGSIYSKVFKIDACGNVSNYTGVYGAVSDSRLKENIVNCSPKLEDLLKVRVVNYNLKGPDSSKYIGVVAQELEELFPELVAETNTHERFKSVNYSNLTILLIKAFQEQQILINNLNTSLEELENSV